MTPATLSASVRGTIQRLLNRRGRGTTRVTDESRIRLDLGIDELDMLEAQIDLEDAFDLEFTRHDFGTVGDLVDYLAQRVGVSEAA